MSEGTRAGYGPMRIDGLALLGAIFLGAAAPATRAETLAGWHFPENATIEKLSRGLCEGCKDTHDAEACRDFALTRTQVRVLLSRAHPITQQEFTQHYQGAPCVVRGVARWSRTALHFEISATLIVTVWRKDGPKQLLACNDDCEWAVLGPGSAAPVQR